MKVLRRVVQVQEHVHERAAFVQRMEVRVRSLDPTDEPCAKLLLLHRWISTSASTSWILPFIDEV